MKTFIFIFTLVLLLNSCIEKQIRGVIVDVGVKITIQDKAGVDLLNPHNPGAYLYENIKTYTLEHGVKTEVFRGNLDYPKDFLMYENDGKYFMRLFLNGSLDGDLGVTYVQWSENDMDTFKYEISTANDNIICTKVWYNDSLVWTTADYSKRGRTVDIIK
jgi:hypothetical protein